MTRPDPIKTRIVQPDPRPADHRGGSASLRAAVAPPPSSVRPMRDFARFAVSVLILEAAVVLADPGPTLLPYLLVLVPALSALGVAALAGRAEVGALVHRVGVWRVRPRWYAAALGIPLAEKIIVDLAGLAVGVTTMERLLQALTLSALIVPVVVVLPALVEEIGWRGFGVQKALDAGHSRLWAALVVGVLFLSAHLPLSLPGQMYAGLPFWPLPLIVLSGAVLLTWIYRATGSVLIAALMHAALNGTVPLTWGLDPAWVWQVRAVVLVVLAAGVVVASAISGHRRRS